MKIIPYVGSNKYDSLYDDDGENIVEILLNFQKSMLESKQKPPHLLLIFDDFIKAPHEEYRKLLTFVGLEHDGRTLFTKINENKNLIYDDRYKVAVVYTPSSIKLFLNGELIVDESNFNYTGLSLDRVEYNYPSGNVFGFDMPVNQTLVFPTALSDDECIALTTIS